MLGFNQSATVHILQSWGVHLPRWFAQLPAMAGPLRLLRDAQAGKPNVYADCFCAPW